MSEFVFDLAGPDDEPAIRRLLAHNPVPGQVTVTYEREPDYFRGCATMGRFCQVLVARHRPSGQVAGVAARTTRPLFVNGQVEEVGYIGQLRVDDRFRGRWIVSAGFRFFHHLHADGRVAGYLTTIIEGNRQAQGILVKRARRHFPAYQEVDRLCTLAIILRSSLPRRLQARFSTRTRTLPKQTQAGYSLSLGSTAELSEIIAFLRRHGAAKQFFPAYTKDDFDDPVTLDFSSEDFIVARRRDEIVGVIGLWDQSGYKQTIVHSYQNSLRWLRPFYNTAGRLLGVQPLPSPGRPIHFIYASFICIAGNDPHIFHLLLGQAYAEAAARGYAYLMVGLSIRDPLLLPAKRYAHIPYYSRLYTVCWQDGLSFHEKLDQRVPYVEIAAL